MGIKVRPWHEIMRLKISEGNAPSIFSDRIEASRAKLKCYCWFSFNMFLSLQLELLRRYESW